VRELKVITIHSFKGGTGKSLIATNLAAAYALRGSDTCLIDMDFRAPTLHVVFKPQGAKWFNDYLDGRCGVEEVLSEMGAQLGLKAKLSVAFANPSPEAIREMMVKSLNWERQALGRLLEFTRRLKQMGYEYCIIDTSPGYIYSSINALVAADTSVIVLTMDDSDVEGTKEMLNELYKLLERRALLILNKAVGNVENAIKSVKERIGEEPLGIIACSCDIAARPRRSIYVVEDPQHPFAKDIEEVASKIAQH